MTQSHFVSKNDLREAALARKARKELEDRYRPFFSAFDRSRMPMIITDPKLADNPIVFANPAFLQLTGYEEDEVVGRNCRFLQGPLTDATAISAVRDAVKTGNGIAIDLLNYRKDGTAFWNELFISPIPDEKGNVDYFFASQYDISRRKTAEALEREQAVSNERLRIAQEAGGIGAFEWFPETGRLLVSGTFREMWGLPEDTDVHQELLNDLVHPDDRSQAGLAVTETLSNPLEYVEFRIRRADSREERWLARSGEQLLMDGHEPRFLGVVFDITPRKQAEERQRLSEARFRTLAETLPQLVWTCLPDGQNNYLSSQWINYTGIPMEQQLGLGWMSQLHPDDRDRTLAHWMGTVAGRHPYDIDFRIRRHDGVYRWFKARATAIRDELGVVVQWFGTCTDIQSIVETRELQSRLRGQLEDTVSELTRERDRIFLLSRDLFAVAGFDGRLRVVNPSWGRLLRYTENELLDQPFADLIHPDDRARSGDVVARLQEGETITNYENRLMRSDGETVWIQWTATPEPQNGVFYAVGRDVTAEKERQAELAKAQDELRQSQKMEAVGQLTGGIAHDFNNLLQIVIGNIETLQRTIPADGTRVRRAADNAMTGARRAAILTHRLLAFSRRQPLDPRPTNVNQLVAGMSDLINRTLGETIEVETVLAAGLWNTEVDPHQLETALLNLAVNARDAMPDGGRLTIETANSYLDAEYVNEFAEVPPGQFVAICVSDTGTGMTQEALSRAFEPFFTTKEVGKGTGLGLSMIYGFVRQSGGHIKIYSEVGEGTTVRIYLPRSYSKVGEAPVIEPTAPSSDAGETILLVEDDENVRQSSAEVLRELGYQVLEAGDGLRALDIIRRSGSSIDLLFTDVVLPGGMTGAELSVQAQEAVTGLRVLFTTGYARNAIVHHGRLDAGVHLLPKPFTFAELASKVRDVLDAAD